MGGKLDPEPDTQSPFYFPEAPGTVPVDGRAGVRWDLAVLLIDPGDSYDEKEVRSFLEGKTTARRKNKPKFLRFRWYEYSLSYQVFRTIRQRLHPCEHLGLDLRQAVRGNEWKVAWLNNPQATPWFTEGLEQSARAVRGMQKSAAQQGFNLVMVIYPYPKMVAEGKMKNPYVDFWSQFARENQLPLIDLSPVFATDNEEAGKVLEANFIPGDFHWNARGSSRVAEFLLPWILKNPPVRPGGL
jgi:hypothetical protein